MFTRIVMGALLVLGAHSAVLANATIPAKDIAGAKDDPSIKRYDGSFIVSYERQSFTDFKVPLSPLEPTDRRDDKNNKLYLPKKEVELEGAKTRLAYVIPAERSPLEVLRNYEDVVKAAGGQILFTCKGDGCGGDANRSSAGGGGNSSLMMYFLLEKQLKDASFSNGSCAQTTSIDDQRFFTARIPRSSGDTYVTVHTYKISDDLYCKAFSICHDAAPMQSSNRWLPTMASMQNACAAPESACWRQPHPTTARKAGRRTGASKSSS